MFKISRLIVLALLGVEALCSVKGPITPYEQIQNGDEENFTFIDDMLLASSRYTQKDEDDPTVIGEYRTKYTLSYTPAELALMGFTEMMSDEHVTVYFEKDSFSVIIIDEDSGYQWSSRPEFQGFSGSREDNTAARNLMNSGLWIDYVRSEKVSSSTITTASLYTFADVSYENNAAYDESNPDQTRPYWLEDGSYDSNAVSITVGSITADSFLVSVSIMTIGLSFDVRLSLIEGQLDALIDVSSITESNVAYQAMGIYLFPYLGAAREDKMPGYIVIPDGIGAMVRTNQYYNTYFQANFYGSDRGYRKQTITELNLPIYGMVHEVGQAGYLANIIQGAEHATLISYLWGKSTHYQRVSNRFNLRQIYEKIIDQAGNGYEVIPDEMINSSFQIRYSFLEGDDASYVGIGKGYRDYLQATGVLSARERSGNGNIPIEIDYILSEQEPSFIGTSTVTMTTPDQMGEAYDYFMDHGLTNQQMTLLGWSKDGFINRAPFRFRVNQKQALKSLISRVQEDGNAVLIDNNYFVSTDLSHRINYGRDVVKDLSKLKMTEDIQDDTTKVKEVFFLHPEASLSKSQDDLSDYESLGVNGIALGSVGDTLFSYFDDGIHSRSEAIATYQTITAQYDTLALAQPFAYLLGNVDSYTDLPITNTQFDYYSDLIPLLPIVLKGSISYYTPYLNFNALGIDRLLSMIDFGVNPSYVLTQKPSSDLRYTESRGFYTTTFADFDEEIVETYQYLNTALSEVVGAYITNREMVDTGFSKVTYSNDVVIYVNYSSSVKSDGGTLVPSHSYRVVNA